MSMTGSMKDDPKSQSAFNTEEGLVSILMKPDRILK